MVRLVSDLEKLVINLGSGLAARSTEPPKADGLTFGRDVLDSIVRDDMGLLCCGQDSSPLVIRQDGIYLNGEAANELGGPWHHPHGKAKPVLPFPFTLEQFRSFCQWHLVFEWEAIEAPFMNDDGTLDERALGELEGRNQVAARLVRLILTKDASAQGAADEMPGISGTPAESSLPQHAVEPLAAASSASPAAAGLPEAVPERNARRLREFEELGGEAQVSGGVATLVGRRGALQELVDRERAAGRPRSDRSDISKALKAEALRRHKFQSG